MKKKTPVKAKEKSMLTSAGEVVGTIGHEIVVAKDKLVEVAHAVVDKFKGEKKEITKKAKKTTSAVKKAAAKKSVKKIVKKAAKKAVVKTKKVAKKVVKKK